MFSPFLLQTLKQIAQGLASQFGANCEVVIHDLTQGVDQTIVAIENGHVSSRKLGDGPSHVVLEALHGDQNKLQDHLGYLAKTQDGKVLKSSTIYIRDETNRVVGIFAINFDITHLLIAENALKAFTQVEQTKDNRKEPERIVPNVNDLLEELIDQSVHMVGKPVALMTKEDKIKAIQFLNDTGAFLITKSGDKISRFFGISKYTLYSYLDAK